MFSGVCEAATIKLSIDWFGKSTQPGRESRRLNAEDLVFQATAVELCSHANAADFFDRPLGTEVLPPDQEDNAVDEPEGVTEHEPLHLPVVGPTPMGSGQERPPDFDLALPFVVAVEPRRPDHTTAFVVEGEQCAARFQGL